MLGTWLRGGTITNLRGLAWLSFTETGHILRGSVVSDGGGGGTTVRGTIGSYPCRLDPLTSDESMTADRLSDRSTHIVSTVPGIGVTVGDQFRVDGRGNWEVTGVNDQTLEPFTVFEVVSAS